MFCFLVSVVSLVFWLPGVLVAYVASGLAGSSGSGTGLLVARMAFGQLNRGSLPELGALLAGVACT